MVAKMKPGAVVVDVAIDQGGCFETSRPTTHSDPSYLVGGVIHYCVANMPGAVARTSTFGLTNATYPFVEALANRGLVAALNHDVHLRNGLNVHRGQLASEPVASAQQLDFVPAVELLAA
jgi:alanine dehydrogenase